MLRRITLTLALLAMVGFGLAQSLVIAPTEGPGNDAFGISAPGTTGPFTATVLQQVNLKIPPVVALHLDVTDLEFDISKVGIYDGKWVCVYGPGYMDEDVTQGYIPSGTTLPLGTYYQTGTWPHIEIIGHGGVAPIQVTQYPPREFVSGELVVGSKNYFVCYRTFILQKFSTIVNWSLSVTRAGGTYDMYIQDNTCSDWGAATGLWKLEEGVAQDLLGRASTNLTGGTTGELVTSLGNQCPQGKSWLDDLVVVAVKVNGEEHGNNTSTLTYSLTATVPQ